MTKKKSNEPRRYELDKSPLFRLSSKKKLSVLLRVDLQGAANLDSTGLTTQYNSFIDKKSRRHITEPTGELAKVHRQLLKLLIRIAPPDYVHSAVKKRSYRTNAFAHKDNCNVLKIDIRKFFQSVNFDRIYDFFRRQLECAPDIATILAKLCAVRTDKHGVHLPTGSCISPVLSFLVNQTLFDRIRELSYESGCVFTLYVDDITISGEKANADLLNLVAAEIFKRGYVYHKINVSKKDHSLITGLIVREGRLYLPYDRIKKIKDLMKLLEISVGPKDKILASLVGRLAEAEQIEPRYKAIRLRIVTQYASEWSKVVEKRSNKSRTVRARRITKSKVEKTVPGIDSQRKSPAAAALVRPLTLQPHVAEPLG